ncbi:hypothetical protein HHL19_00595 [Streptomyces sp. R302]|uniref:hypothetical protein n=1 Tax=unclassified Streptomyces TaxID=2593676 RepID=UPI00145C67E9|nr:MULTISPECIES: hypothetical protein [unclassified Streptomyces]NML48870.1 hypothetical protein [Streptomyces sp. R301]NML77197.1 hypothetical protein [Streptomyces sp. R302]
MACVPRRTVLAATVFRQLGIVPGRPGASTASPSRRALHGGTPTLVERCAGSDDWYGTIDGVAVTTS